MHTTRVVGADIEFNVVNMYVMSSMPPHQQSVAGGIFQTVTKLCGTIGLGVTTAIFDAAQKRPMLSSYWDRDVQPYTSVYWCCFALAAFSILLVPFFNVDTQGGVRKEDDRDGDAASEQSRHVSVSVEAEKHEEREK